MLELSIKRKIQLIAFSLFALFVMIILVRIFFIFLNEDSSAQILRFWIDTLSQPLVNPFEGIYNSYFIEGIRIESASFLAILIYLILGYLAARIVGVFVPFDPRYIILDLIDFAFKVVEFVLIMRLLFRLTAANVSNSLVDFVYDLSFIFYEPFEGLMPTITFGDASNYIFETSTFIAIVLIIIFDLVTEGILRNLFGLSSNQIIEEKRRKANLPKVTNVNVRNQNPYQPPIQQPMNITVNVPQQGYSSPPPQNNNFKIQVEDINKPTNRA